MTNAERLEQIKKRTDANAADDVAFLVSLINQLEDKIGDLERKNKLLVQQNLELTAAIEDIKADFDRRQDR